MFFRKIQGENKWENKRDNGAVDGMVFEKWPHDPVRFFFAKRIQRVCENGINHSDYHRNDEQPKKPFYFFQVDENTASIE